MEQITDRSPEHEVGADQSGEDDRARNGFLCGLGKAQQEEGDEGDGNLDADGILGGADKAGDLKGLLDPSGRTARCIGSRDQQSLVHWHRDRSTRGAAPCR